MISLDVQGTVTVVEHLDQIPGRLRAKLRVGMGKIGQMLERHVKVDKLSGQALKEALKALKAKDETR